VPSLLIMCLLLWSFNVLAATKDDKAIGLVLGNPSGVSGKLWLAELEAVDAVMGISPGRQSRVNLHSDYLWHRPGAFYFNDEYPLDFYYGLGGRMEFGDDIELGLRVPVGLVHQLSTERAEVFVEAAPILDFISRFGLEIHLLAGARYYF
jgi:hypothetical protein